MGRISFLDNLENSLKSLENSDERDGSERKRQESERERSLAAAPWAQKLKDSAYTKQLFEDAAVAGHRIRAKIYMAWLDNNLRLEARGRRLELRPTANGILADFIEVDGASRSRPVDLEGRPAELIEDWLNSSRI